MDNLFAKMSYLEVVSRFAMTASRGVGSLTSRGMYVHEQGFDIIEEVVEWLSYGLQACTSNTVNTGPVTLACFIQRHNLASGDTNATSMSRCKGTTDNLTKENAQPLNRPHLRSKNHHSRNPSLSSSRVAICSGLQANSCDTAWPDYPSTTSPLQASVLRDSDRRWCLSSH